MAHVVVTGGAGFIGSHIVDELLSLGHEVHIIDNLSSGKKENISPDAKFHEIDICSSDIIKLLADIKPKYVLHQAAKVSVPDSFENPAEYYHNNVFGTQNVLDAARKANAKRVVLASSCAVYGNCKPPQREGKETGGESPYAITKTAGEQLCKMFHKVYGLETVCLRYFNVFGPGQNQNSQYSAAIPKFSAAILSGKPPTIFGDGEQTRDFVYVKNIVNANILAMEKKGISGEIINVGNSRPISVNELVRKIGDILGIHTLPEYAPLRQGEIKHSYANNSKAKRLLGYKEIVSFDDGLSKTVYWFKQKLR